MKNSAEKIIIFSIKFTSLRYAVSHFFLISFEELFPHQSSPLTCSTEINLYFRNIIYPEFLYFGKASLRQYLLLKAL